MQKVFDIVVRLSLSEIFIGNYIISHKIYLIFKLHFTRFERTKVYFWPTIQFCNRPASDVAVQNADTAYAHISNNFFVSVLSQCNFLPKKNFCDVEMACLCWSVYLHVQVDQYQTLNYLGAEFNQTWYEHTPDVIMTPYTVISYNYQKQHKLQTLRFRPILKIFLNLMFF